MSKRIKPATTAKVAWHLPLRPVACAVLAALAQGPRIGVDILEAVNTTVPGSPLLGPGTLYRLMRDLRQEGLIARTVLEEGSADDRHAPHTLTPLGAAVLEADIARLHRTISLATSRAR
jgi:DNA-binding PadR family transcriptional regulator